MATPLKKRKRGVEVGDENDREGDRALNQDSGDLEDDSEDEQDDEAENDTDEDHDDVIESDDEDDGNEEEIQVEFEARSPVEEDFHGVRTLLAQLFLKGHVDISAIASSIVAQTSVGCILQQCCDSDAGSEQDDPDEEVFGVTTCLPLAVEQNKAFASQLQAFLAQKCADSSTPDLQQKLKEVLGKAVDVGFLVNERFINIPPRIALPTFDSLQQDLKNALKADGAFKLKYFVMILKKLSLRDSARKSKGKKNKYRREAEDPLDAAKTFYVNPEEEFFSEAAELSFCYSVAGERDSAAVGEWTDDDALYDPWREVVLLPCAKLSGVLQRLKQEIQ